MSGRVATPTESGGAVAPGWPPRPNWEPACRSAPPRRPGDVGDSANTAARAAWWAAVPAGAGCRLAVVLALVCGLGLAPGLVEAQGRRMPGYDIQLEERARFAQRSWLPWVTDVEVWHEKRILGPARHGDPSLVRLRDMEWRIHWNDLRDGGITSAFSVDGGTVFRSEADLRLKHGGRGAPDAVVSHPWVVRLPVGWRMYYQGDQRWPPRAGEAPILRIFSAWSRQGRHYFGEGVRIDLGRATGLARAAHPCVRQLADGTWRMWFSATRLGRGGKPGPSGILGASSEDGLTWRLDRELTIEVAEDPLVFERGGRWVMLARFGLDNVLLLSSPDGVTFSPQAWVEFYDARGLRLSGFTPADVLDAGDGRVRILGVGRNSRGLGLFERHRPIGTHDRNFR